MASELTDMCDRDDDNAECPHCGSRNTDELDPATGEQECYDCGKTYGGAE